MKRILVTFICLFLIFSAIVPASADEINSIIWQQETVLENNIIVIDEVIDHTNARSSTKAYERRKSFYDGETLIAVIAITGTFSYNGSTVSVLSKSVSQSSTYDGWNYKQSFFTSNSGTIALEGNLTKLIVLSIPISMTLSCDKNGNISYT